MTLCKLPAMTLAHSMGGLAIALALLALALLIEDDK
jgi:hypothetical protein